MAIIEQNHKRVITKAPEYFSGPCENILALRQYFKILLFQITKKTDLTHPLP